MHIDLDEMSQRLGRPVPELYRAFIECTAAAQYQGTLADPAEICALNLAAARAVGSPGPTTYGLVLYGQDGDYYLLSDADHSGALYSWSHETSEITRSDAQAKALLEELAATRIPELDTDCVVLSRVEPCSQAMLCPIDPRELAAATEGIPNVVAFDSIEGTNPFTQEPIRLDSPGIEIAVEGCEPLVLELVDGYLLCNEVQSRLPEQLLVVAKRLGAHVFASPQLLPASQS